MATPVRIGTCSWADDALSKYFYPPKLPAKERLAWYSQFFDTVEVDSTYYRLPGESMVQGWADRTPDGFTMHVKAFGLMTRHPVKLEVLPEDLRDAMPVDERGQVERPPRELRGEVFRRFLESLEPLRSAGKLGGILFQFPSYVVFKDASFDYLEWAREQLGSDEMLVEFRHRSWLDEDNRAETLSLLERIGAAYVTVDAPQLGHGEEPHPDRAGGDRRHGVRPLSRAQPRHVEQARRLGGRALRLSLLRRGARASGRDAEGARGRGEAGVRVLQQQRDVGRIRRTRSAASRRRRRTLASCECCSTAAASRRPAGTAA